MVHVCVLQAPVPDLLCRRAGRPGRHQVLLVFVQLIQGTASQGCSSVEDRGSMLGSPPERITDEKPDYS